MFVCHGQGEDIDRVRWTRSVSQSVSQSVQSGGLRYLPTIVCRTPRQILFRLLRSAVDALRARSILPWLCSTRVGRKKEEEEERKRGRRSRDVVGGVTLAGHHVRLMGVSLNEENNHGDHIDFCNSPRPNQNAQCHAAVCMYIHSRSTGFSPTSQPTVGHAPPSIPLSQSHLT